MALEAEWGSFGRAGKGRRTAAWPWLSTRKPECWEHMSGAMRWPSPGGNRESQDPWVSREPAATAASGGNLPLDSSVVRTHLVWGNS